MLPFYKLTRARQDNKALSSLIFVQCSTRASVGCRKACVQRRRNKFGTGTNVLTVLSDICNR